MNSLLLCNWATWDDREIVCKDAESIFQRGFHGRRRSRIVRSLFNKRDTTDYQFIEVVRIRYLWYEEYEKYSYLICVTDTWQTFERRNSPPPTHPKVVVTEESRTPCCKNQTFRADSFIMLFTLANIRSFFISGIKVGSSLPLLNGEKMKWYYQIILQNYYYCYFYPENSYSYRWTPWFPFCDFLCQCVCCLSIKSNCGLRNAL